VTYLRTFTATELLDEFKEKYPKFNANTFSLPICPNQDLCEINYTSGTSGFSKGVMLTYNSISANITYAIANMPLVQNDHLVSILPLAHAYGCAFEFLFPFTIGCHIHFLTRNPSPKVIMQAFAEIKPRLILMVPLILEKVYKKQLLPKLQSFPLNILMHIPGIKLIIHKKILTQLMESFGGNFIEVVVGGAAMNAEVEDFLRLIKFPFTTGYGMTECGPLITYSRYFDLPARSCGAPMTFVEVKIDSPNPLKSAGEILVKGENVMVGYYKNPEATEEALDSEGWLHTGDLGIINEKGQIFIKGRCKTMILGSSGQNIYPEHIEGLYNNKYYVQESLIIEKSHKLVCLIFPDYERADHHKLTRAELQEMMEQYRKEINKQLGSFEQISQVVLFPEEFEKTPKRSIKRYLYKNVSIPT
jgi:long-chain acyl-CoA synthetase